MATATGAQTYNCLPYSYPIQIAHASQGVQQALEILKHVAMIAKIFFASFTFGAIYGYTYSARPLFIGLNVIGAATSAVLWGTNHLVKLKVEFWSSCLENLRMGKINEATNQLREVLKSDPLGGDDRVFNSCSLGFFYFEPRLRKIEPAHLKLPAIHALFGNMLLHHSISILKNTDSTDDGIYKSLQEEIQLAQKILANQRHGITEEQLQIIKFFKGTKEAAKAEVDKIPLPTSFSVGHGLLLNIYYEFSEERLDSWQYASKQAKIWLEKSGDYQDDSIEKKVIEGMLAARNMREFMDVLLGDFKENLNYFQNKMAPTA